MIAGKIPYLSTRPITPILPFLATLAVVLALGWPVVALAADGSISIKTEPADGDVEVSTGANIAVRFDRPMDLGTIVPASILVNGQPLSSYAGGSVVYPGSDGSEAVILISMRPNTPYRITLPATVTDKKGQSLDEPYSWQFTTASPIDKPQQPMRSFARYPRMNEWNIPTNAPVTVMFTSELDATSVTETSLQVRSTSGGDPVAGKLSVQGARLIFRPDSPLKPNHPYEAVLAATIRSKWSVTMERPSSWQFNTGSGPGEGPIITDCWYESHSSPEGLQLVFHAATEVLVKPGTGAGKSAKIAQAVQALKASVVSLTGLVESQPLSTPTDVNAKDMPISDGSPATVVTAAYTHSGGSGLGNSVVGKTLAVDKVSAAVGNALASDKALDLKDSGDVSSHGDQTGGDSVYSGRVWLERSFPEGQAVIAFSVLMPDGTKTEPVTVSTYVVQPPSAPSTPVSSNK